MRQIPHKTGFSKGYVLRITQKLAAPRRSRHTPALNVINSKVIACVICALSLGSLLTGCGGASTSKSLQPFVPSGPAVYGVQLPIGTAPQMGETSGFGKPDFSVGYVTGAIASNAKPPVGIASANNGTIPLGFFAGGEYIDGSIGLATPPGGQVIFAVDISNGNDSRGNLIPINPASVVLTNIPGGAPDLPPADAGINFNQPLHFQFPVTGGRIPIGPFSNVSYTTNAFALPFNTTGLHGARVTVGDAAGNVSFTDFYTLVLANTDSAVLVQIIDANGAVPGATVSITNAMAGVTAYNPPVGQPTESVTDKQGIAILFAAPGSQTITATAPNSETGMDTQTLTAGQVFDSASGKAYTITIH